MRVPPILACVLWLAAAACAGARPASNLVGRDSALVPDHLAVAPPCGVDGDLGRQLWFALARGASARGFELTRDPGAAQLLIALEERRAQSGLGHDAELALDRAAVHDVLAERFGVQAVMHAAVVPRHARFHDGVARWDGAEERILAPARDVHTRVDGYRGTAEAWSLRVWVEDEVGGVLAESYGGLTLAERMIAGRWERCAARPPLEEADLLIAAAERAVGGLPAPE